MAEPLAVDPAGLGAAGTRLRGLVFPTPPAPIVAAGTDALSVAINTAMLNIESSVTDLLPSAKADMANTASSMATAADIYTKVDESLGENLSQHQFRGSAPILTGSTVTDQAGQFVDSMATSAWQWADRARQGVETLIDQLSPQISEVAAQVAEAGPQLAQLGSQAAFVAQYASPMAQSIGQSTQQIVSTASQAGGAAPAQHGLLVDDTKNDDADDDRDAKAGADGAGAAPGSQTLGGAPIEGGTGTTADNQSAGPDVTVL
ncbi:hypothetical protein [Mycobacterium marinum]|uniref:hypothetical protein n=1 Tax=Mycobacterium marinum TaxID=1781 RepID=UPI002359AEF5|nr:hypothetical protein [Mycobacterium marinum]MDC8971147.1 hypothetical protein [Mycobacterium marinum]